MTKLERLLRDYGRTSKAEAYLPYKFAAFELAAYAYRLYDTGRLDPNITVKARKQK